jgi:hypothetical protein
MMMSRKEEQEAKQKFCDVLNCQTMFNDLAYVTFNALGMQDEVAG